MKNEEQIQVRVHVVSEVRISQAAAVAGGAEPRRMVYVRAQPAASAN